MTTALSPETFSQWSNVACQNAVPDVAARISLVKSKVPATGMKPVTLAVGPFSSMVWILPSFLVILLVISPTCCGGTVTVILYMGCSSIGFAVRNEPNMALDVAGMICVESRFCGSGDSWASMILA